MSNDNTLRLKRLALQKALDAEKSALERNKLGQFATPSSLADSILTLGLSALDKSAAIKFLDPAFGLGSFYDSLLRTHGTHKITQATGLEIDPHYFVPALDLWKTADITINRADFTVQPPPEREENKYNLLICNPPYVRHHHLQLAEKIRLQDTVAQTLHITSSKLMGLYGYFLLLAHQWLQTDGVAVWLIPTEFMDVNYGSAIKKYLSENVTLLRVHTFRPEDVQFDDALVSSTIVMFKNRRPAKNHQTIFSLGGTLDAPKAEHAITQSKLNYHEKWSKLARGDKPMDKREAVKFSDLFQIKRGIATGSNAFFIVTKQEAERRKIPEIFLQPILPSSRYITGDIIEANQDGSPSLEKNLYLLNCNLPEHIVRREYPDLWNYLEEGRSNGVANGYICRNRKPWYRQELRDSPDLVVSYMGRSRENAVPFKFYVNKSRAVAANSYLMIYMKPHVRLKAKKTNMQRLIASIASTTEEIFLDKGRSYGGGLHKLEPKELGNIPLYGVGDLMRDATLPV